MLRSATRPRRVIAPQIRPPSPPKLNKPKPQHTNRVRGDIENNMLPVRRLCWIFLSAETTIGCPGLGAPPIKNHNNPLFSLDDHSTLPRPQTSVTLIRHTRKHIQFFNGLLVYGTPSTFGVGSRQNNTIALAYLIYG
jgi:hypothetical protein